MLHTSCIRARHVHVMLHTSCMHVMLHTSCCTRHACTSCMHVMLHTPCMHVMHARHVAHVMLHTSCMHTSCCTRHACTSCMHVMLHTSCCTRHACTSCCTRHVCTSCCTRHECTSCCTLLAFVPIGPTPIKSATLPEWFLDQKLQYPTSLAPFIIAERRLLSLSSPLCLVHAYNCTVYILPLAPCVHACRSRPHRVCHTAGVVCGGHCRPSHHSQQDQPTGACLYMRVCVCARLCECVCVCVCVCVGVCVCVCVCVCV